MYWPLQSIMRDPKAEEFSNFLLHCFGFLPLCKKNIYYILWIYLNVKNRTGYKFFIFFLKNYPFVVFPLELYCTFLAVTRPLVDVSATEPACKEFPSLWQSLEMISCAVDWPLSGVWINVGEDVLKAIEQKKIVKTADLTNLNQNKKQK